MSCIFSRESLFSLEVLLGANILVAARIKMALIVAPNNAKVKEGSKATPATTVQRNAEKLAQHLSAASLPARKPNTMPGASLPPAPP